MTTKEFNVEYNAIVTRALATADKARIGLRWGDRHEKPVVSLGVTDAMGSSATNEG